jgi:hypothetical protein
MTVQDVVACCGFDVVCGAASLGRAVRGGYASDLLSDVLAHAPEGAIWVTLQAHANIVAVAGMRELSAIVLVGGRQPEADTLAKAKVLDLPILSSSLPAYDTVCRLSAQGVPGAFVRGAGA